MSRVVLPVDFEEAINRHFSATYKTVDADPVRQVLVCGCGVQRAPTREHPNLRWHFWDHLYLSLGRWFQNEGLDAWPAEVAEGLQDML